MSLLLLLGRLFSRGLLATGCICLSHGVFGVLGVRRKGVAQALAQAFPELSPGARRKIARAHRTHLGRSLAEFLEGVAITETALRAQITLDGFEALREAAARGEGVIVVTAHLGSWELAAVAAARFGLPLAIVSRRLRVGFLDRAWARLRARAGLIELPARGSATRILGHLREGGTLGLVIDQHTPPPSGIPLPFFGRAAFTARAPAVLHRRSGAPLYTVVLVREAPWRHRLVVRPFPVGPQEDTVAILLRLNAWLEARIGERPEQWLWLHRRWKSASRPPRGGLKSSAPSRVG